MVDAASLSERGAILAALVAELTEPLPAPELTRRSLVALRRLLPSCRVTYLAVEPSGEGSVVLSLAPAGSGGISGHLVCLLPAELDLATAIGGPRIVSDARRAPSPLPCVARLPNGATGAVAELPLVRAGQLVGLLSLDRPAPHVWTDGEIETLVIVGGLLSLALAAADRASPPELDHRSRLIVEQIPAVAYLEQDETTQGVFSISPQIEELLGYPRSNWLADPGFWMTILHPEDAERVAAAHRRVGRTGEPFHETYRYVAQDGRVVWVEDRTAAVRDPKTGQIRYWQGFMVDVTARKETEQRLADAERLYRNLVEQLPAATWIADANLTRLTYLSPQAESLLGYPLTSWLEDPGFWLGTVHPEDRPRVEQTIAAAVAAGGPYVNEFRQFTGDGRTIWIRDVGRPVRDEGGAIVNWLGVVQDITAQREVSQRLVEAEEHARAADRRYRTLVEQLPAVVWTRPAGLAGAAVPIDYISPQIEAFLGFTAEEYLADPFLVWSLAHPDDVAILQGLILRSWETSVPYSHEYRMRTRTGDERWVRSNVNLVRDEETGRTYWHGVSFDITDRKHGEEALARSEARYRTLVEQLPAVTYVSRGDEVGTVTYISPQCETLLGYPPATWTDDPTTWGRLIHPDDRAAARDEYAAAIPMGTGYDLAYRMIAADGRTVWVQDKSVPVRDESGRITHWQGFVVDVTKLKEAESRLAEAELRYRTLVEQLPAITYIDAKDESGLLYISPQVEVILGHAPEQFLGQRGVWASTIYPDDRARTLAAEHEAVTSGQPFRAEYRQLRADGQAIWVQDQHVPVLDPTTGTSRYRLGFAFDISERKRVEEALRESDERFRAAFDHAAIGMALIGRDGRLLLVNQALCTLTGLSEPELLERSLGDLLHPDEPASPLRHLDRLVAGARPSIQVEGRFLRRDGTTGWGLFGLSIVQLGAGGARYFVGQVVDVTRAREADRLKDEFVATVSHELRTPLTSISGFVDLLLDGAAGPLPPRAERYLKLMRNNSRRLAALIDDLLDLSRIEVGRLTLRRVSLDLAAVLQAAVASVEPQFAAKDQELRIKAEDDLPAVLADGERIAQVLANLLSNAHKYTPTGGSIVVRATTGGELARVEVTDTGIGLSQEEQALVFTRFFRADRQDVKDAGGTGLGLAIARALVELHEGTIDVSSAPGQGATFSFTLPLAPAPAERFRAGRTRRMPPFRPN